MNNQSLLKNQAIAKSLKENIKNVCMELTKEGQRGCEEGKPTNNFKIFEEADSLKIANRYNMQYANANGYIIKDYNRYKILILTLKDLLRLYNDNLYFTRAKHIEEVNEFKMFINEVKTNIQYQMEKLMDILNESLINKNYDQYRCLINCYGRLSELDKKLDINNCHEVRK